jgi:hypothetical protein
MRRSYIEAHCTLRDAFVLARRWGGDGPTTLIAPSTRDVEASPWLEHAGVPLGTAGNRHTRFAARPRGTAIAWCLRLEEILEMERRNTLDALVLVRATTQHAPWITAHSAEHVGGEVVPPVEEASAAIKAAVDGLSGIAVLNQGLVDSRERSGAVQALTYLRRRRHRLEPDQLATEAIRRGWPGTSPIELAKIATDLNAGKNLRFQKRVAPEALARWAAGEPD